MVLFLYSCTYHQMYIYVYINLYIHENIWIHTHTEICICAYIYIYRERERERERTFSFTPESFLMPHPSQPCSKQLLLWFLYYRLVLVILECHINRPIEYVFICVLFFSLNIVHPILSHFSLFLFPTDLPVPYSETGESIRTRCLIMKNNF